MLYGVVSLFFLIGIYLLTRGNATPYKYTQLESFTPLTHLEIKQRKPFIWKLSDDDKNAKWVYECNLLKTSELSVLWQNKDRVLTDFENKELNFSLEYIIIYLTKLLYQIGKKPRGIIKRIQYKRYFFKYCFENIEATIKVFNSMIEYQTRLFFFVKMLKEKVITQQEEYSKTNGDLSLPEEIPHGPQYTSNIFLNLSTKKKNTTSKKTIKKASKSLQEEKNN